ncbi:hypothetical protein [Pseudooceanicola aestuarii]|uniref:hypothetical protein n=1 Tax=Pseudooceanicola aestuarii TaxID=2697319 RepID=UPI0013D3085F|nr:hypothetical protein [Pseudooceanicola aestuarii]
MIAIRQKRRVQIVCAAFLHIPLAAIAAYALAGEGVGEHTGILGVALVSTVAATLLIVPYIGRVLDGGTLQAAG